MAAQHEQAGDCPDDMESVEEEEAPKSTAMESLELSNIKEQAQNEVNEDVIPISVKRRIKALKRVQLEATDIEAQFFKDVHDLECRYQELFQPLYEKRKMIVSGSYEPNDKEAEWSSDEELSESLSQKMRIPCELDDQKGIPEFWLTIFRNVSLVSDMVKQHDVPILKHLMDVRAISKKDPMGFILEFHFSSNDFFTDSVLTKAYEMKCAPDHEDPFSFEGPEIYKSTGCKINWNTGKNITLKSVKKKQKHKSRGVIRTVHKTVQNDSFFNFFNPPILPDDVKEEDIDDDLKCLLVSDFEIGHYLRERVIPRAVLYFTGEAIEDEGESEEEEDDYTDQEDSDEKNATPQEIQEHY